MCVCVCMSELRLGRAGDTCCECERDSASRAAPRGAPAFAQRLSVDHVGVSQERRFARRRREQRRAITSDERALRSSARIVIRVPAALELGINARSLELSRKKRYRHIGSCRSASSHWSKPFCVLFNNNNLSSAISKLIGLQDSDTSVPADRLHLTEASCFVLYLITCNLSSAISKLFGSQDIDTSAPADRLHLTGASHFLFYLITGKLSSFIRNLFDLPDTITSAPANGLHVPGASRSVFYSTTTTSHQQSENYSAYKILTHRFPRIGFISLEQAVLSFIQPQQPYISNQQIIRLTRYRHICSCNQLRLTGTSRRTLNLRGGCNARDNPALSRERENDEKSQREARRARGTTSKRQQRARGRSRADNRCERDGPLFAHVGARTVATTYDISVPCGVPGSVGVERKNGTGIGTGMLTYAHESGKECVCSRTERYERVTCAYVHCLMRVLTYQESSFSSRVLTMRRSLWPEPNLPYRRGSPVYIGGRKRWGPYVA
ncbi:unnamed protein product [Trichogramma brassicae]|uniref:Uncharacterized protein n=1 Tax=Trichogramma brassicae TaxID=86971 RepID=A0A6H5J0C9_9HYME|nr:unnamed protein product [Trichogramma brassicae]